MNQASLYQRANAVQQHDAKQVLEEYAHLMQWRADGRDTLLDVGCGSGNVLMEYVYPLLPPHSSSLLGTDISAKMIAYAHKVYGQYERANFRVLDIGTEKLPKDLSGAFDHVTSFYCLHWVQNQKVALRNIYQLLRPSGGDCLLAFLADNPIYQVYRALAQQPKWGVYMRDVDKFISPLSNSEDPCAEYSRLVSEIGFVDYSVEVRNQVYVYEGVDSLKDNISAICPFVERIPAHLHAEFFDDLVQTVVSLKFSEANNNATDYKFISSYKLIIVYARKPPPTLSGVDHLLLSEVIEAERALTNRSRAEK